MGSPSVQEDGELSNQGSNDGDFSDLFVVDSTPAEDHNNFVGVPVYEKKFSEVLQVQPKEVETAKPERRKPPQNTCWNCGGEHSMRDCKERKNYEAINHNRQIFMNKQTQRYSKTSRYHLDEVQKYAHIQAGKISRRLRRALGLQANQLPRHIYQMRCLGYPPGWVEEARVSHSGLFLFNSEGQEVADPGFEDGEIAAEGSKDKFDIKKIIEYPGFNCPCDPDTVDETERFNSKPMAEKDSIEFMKTMWQSKAVKAYKRKKMNALDSSGTSNAKSRSLLLDDMELDSEDDVSSNEEGEGVEGSIENAVGTTIESTPSQAIKRCGSVSPSPVDSKRQRVVEDVVKSENSQDSDAANKSSGDVDTDIDPVSTPAKSTSSNLEQVDNDAVSTPAKSTPSNLGHVKSVSLGTPVIVTSPFTCLPSADKFSKNICDVINFENLPDSTGKYEKMSGLIKKVRTFVTKLNSEDDE